MSGEHACPSCDATFPSKGSLRWHLIKHADDVQEAAEDDPFQELFGAPEEEPEETSGDEVTCDVCQAVFPSIVALLDHCLCHIDQPAGDPLLDNILDAPDSEHDDPNSFVVHLSSDEHQVESDARNLSSGESWRGRQFVKSQESSCESDARNLSSGESWLGRQFVKSQESSCDSDCRNLSSGETWRGRQFVKSQEPSCESDGRNLSSGDSWRGRQQDLKSQASSCESEDCVIVKEELHGCGKCGAKFSSLPLLERHKATHLPASHRCSRCPAAFTSELTLWDHLVKAHTTPEPVSYTCSVCGDRLGSFYHLTQHLKSHSSQSWGPVRAGGRAERPHPYRQPVIPFCPRPDGKPAFLGVPPAYVCNVCSWSFPTEASVRQHVISCHFATPYFHM